MARPFDGSTFEPAKFNSWKPATISFVQKLTTSESFKGLFREGMALVEESAGYLDGAGREEARQLRRPVAMAYASESMRLTTRLMQLASWLLLQRAVNEGDMTSAQAASEKHRVRLTRQDVVCPPELFEELPERLRALTFRSMRLQAQIVHLDRSLSAALPHEPGGLPSPIANQVERLRVAFAAH